MAHVKVVRRSMRPEEWTLLRFSWLRRGVYADMEEITDITYRNSEQLGGSAYDRKAVFDVYCQNAAGEYFIVEMQKAEQDYFKDRSVYYATFPIQEQAKRGDWNYQLKGVYTVGILDFVFPDDEYDPDCMHHEVKLMDVDDKHVFYDKLTFVYLEMPKFRKTEEELETMFDKWLYALRNLSRLMERPAALQERVFTRLFEQAEIARLTDDERRDYEESVKVYRDLFGVMSTAERKGVEKGLEQGRAEGRVEGRTEEKKDIARKMKTMGVDINVISQATGLTPEEIENLE